MLLAFIDCLTSHLHNISELLVVHKRICYPHTHTHTIINNTYNYIATIHGKSHTILLIEQVERDKLKQYITMDLMNVNSFSQCFSV